MKALDSISDLAITIASDPDPQDLAAHLANVTFHELDADVVTLYVRMESDEGRNLVLVGHWGLVAEEEARYTLIQDDFPMPAADAVRHRLPYAMTMEELAKTYPLMGMRPDLRDGTEIFVPIVLGTATVGAALISTNRPFAWSPESWKFAQAVQALLGLYMRVTDRVWLPVRPLNQEFATRQGLTQRQVDVLTLLARGKTIAAISARLGFSESTIKQDIRRSMLALGATDRDALIARAVDHGFIPAS